MRSFAHPVFLSYYTILLYETWHLRLIKRFIHPAVYETDLIPYFILKLLDRIVRALLLELVYAEYAGTKGIVGKKLRFFPFHKVGYPVF